MSTGSWAGSTSEKKFLPAPPVEFPWETRCFVRDPDGHLIEITQPPAG